MTSYTQQGNRPRVMTPLELVCTMPKPALYAYIGLARYADNTTGRASATITQIGDAVNVKSSQTSLGVKQLLDAGWITRLVEGRKGSGASLYVLHMTPMVDTEVQHPETRSLNESASGNPEPENESASGNPDASIRKPGYFLVSSLVSTTSSPACGEVEAHTAKPKAGYSAEFEAFWSAYPKRNGQRVGKKAAAREWAKALKTTTPERLMAAVAKYAVTCNGFPKDAERFLRDEIWADLVPATTTGELSTAEVDEILGPDLTPLPALPPHIRPGSPEAKDLRAQALADRRADRLVQATRIHTRSIA